ncbi:MAG: motility associated factor glycosyltransferase family protein [Sulfurospirillum sp.]|nr:motility associated factor glycosyltransferase family protein [Sulfurospirillum sp.]
MKTIYENNLDVLKKYNEKLYKQLLNIKENSRYEVFQGKKANDINILDTQKSIRFYDNPLKEMKKKIEYFKKFSEYDFLYLFGVANGVVIKKILENKKHQQIVVIEPNIELVYIALNLSDFSKDIISKRLIIILEKDMIFSEAISLFSYKNAKLYARVFKVRSIHDYYGHVYSEKMVKTNKFLLKALEYCIEIVGNSTIDQIIGLKQHLANTPLMLKGPKFSSLKTKKNTDIAIIVSTGPSLHKQLDLLKEIKDYVTIISVDASMPILEKHNIKPDFVVSMERVEMTSIFYKKTSKEFQKDINFISVSLQHKSIFKAINNGTTVLVMRPFHYNAYFQLDDYGYICAGMGCANMAHELTVYMGFKHAVFIGQDLAYGKDGSSHSKNHVLGENCIKEDKTKLNTSINNSGIEFEAYGGKGTVKSTYPWKLFMSGLVNSIGESREIMTCINATEGGARISGTIEMPFKDVIKKYIDKKVKKSKIVLKNTDKNELNKLKIACDERVKKLIEEGESLKEKVEEAFIFISKKLEKIENKELKDVIKAFSTKETITMLNMVNNTRNELSSNKTFNDFYHDILQSVLVHYELELSEIKVSKVTSSKDNQLKAIKWINTHRVWMFDLAGGIWNILDVLKNDYIMSEESEDKTT